MLFRKKVERRCAWCVHAGQADGEDMICKKKGVVSAGGSCRRFSYDPFKRVPARPKPMTADKFKPEDFQL